MLLREMFQQPKTAVVTFGRMNPPTIGHAKLVDKMKSISGDHYLFLSHTVDQKKNPLTFETKKKFVESFFENVTVGNEFVRTPIDMMKHLEEQGYQNVIFVAGSDRTERFQKLFNDYNKKEYTFESIKVISAGERDPDADGAEGMSASKLRQAVQENNFDFFEQGVPVKELAEDLYNEIRSCYGS